MRLKLALVGMFSVVLAFVGTAFAAGAVKPEDGSLLDLAKPILEAIKNGNGWLAAALAVVFVLAAAKRYTPATWKLGRFFHSDVGGMLSAFVFSFAGAIATTTASFVAGGPGMTTAIMLAALKVGTFAIGGFVAIHKLATWFVGTAWFQNHAPGWLKSGVGLLLALIGSNAVEKAEAAGAAAVEANPAPGAGEPTDV